MPGRGLTQFSHANTQQPLAGFEAGWQVFSMERRALEQPDLLIIGFDPMAFDLAMGASALGARVVFATEGGNPVDFAIRDGLLLEKLASGLREPGRAAFETLRRDSVAKLQLIFNPARIAAARVSVETGAVRFLNAREVLIGEGRFRPRRIVIARGRVMPEMPPGLSDLLAHGMIPQRVILAGEGALLATVAQLLAMAGTKVSLVAERSFLDGFDRDFARLMGEHLEGLGVSFLPERPAIRPADWPIWKLERFHPHLAGLDLEKAGFRPPADERPVIDASLRLRRCRASLLGSIAEPEFGLCIRPGMVGYLLAQLLFRKAGAFRAPLAPRVAGVTPQIGEIGLSEVAAMARHSGNIRILRAHSGEAEAAHASPRTTLKLITNRRGVLLGASVFGPMAREQMGMIALALEQKVPVAKLADIPALPASAAALLRLTASIHAREQLRSQWLQRLLRWLRLLG